MLLGLTLLDSLPVGLLERTPRELSPVPCV